jgi:hypothetical protein
MNKISFFLSLLLLFACATSHADTIVYKWLDSTGKVIYSQTPPPTGTPFEIVEKKTPVTLGNNNVTSTSAVAAAERSEKSQTEKLEEQERIAQSEQIKQENCKQAQANLTSLNSRGQVTVKDGDLYRRLSEEERQERISSTQEQINEFCN